jgi:hypothetical protein
MKKPLITLSYLFFILQVQVLSTQANSIGYIEKFSLAEDRKQALAELIPGTRDYYYYQALYAQNEGRHGDVEQLLKTWIKRYGNTSRAREIQNRAALLDYDKNPKKSLAYLKDRLRLGFDHSRKVEGRKPTHPIKLDPKSMDYQTFYNDALRDLKTVVYVILNQVSSMRSNYAISWAGLLILIFPTYPP